MQLLLILTSTCSRMNCSILALSSSSSRAPTLHITAKIYSLSRCAGVSCTLVWPLSCSSQGISPESRSIAWSKRESVGANSD